MVDKVEIGRHDGKKRILHSSSVVGKNLIMVHKCDIQIL